MEYNLETIQKIIPIASQYVYDVLVDGFKFIPVNSSSGYGKCIKKFEDQMQFQLGYVCTPNGYRIYDVNLIVFQEEIYDDVEEDVSRSYTGKIDTTVIVFVLNRNILNGEILRDNRLAVTGVLSSESRYLEICEANIIDYIGERWNTT